MVATAELTRVCVIGVPFITTLHVWAYTSWPTSAFSTCAAPPPNHPLAMIVSGLAVCCLAMQLLDSALQGADIGPQAPGIPRYGAGVLRCGHEQQVSSVEGCEVSPGVCVSNTKC